MSTSEAKKSGGKSQRICPILGRLIQKLERVEVVMSTTTDFSAVDSNLDPILNLVHLNGFGATGKVLQTRIGAGRLQFSP